MNFPPATGRSLLLNAWKGAVAAADPAALVAGRFPGTPAGRLCIIAVGKAAAAMAGAALEHYRDFRGPVHGLVVAPGPLPAALGPLTCVAAEHPLPGPGSFRAGAEAARLAADLGPGDLLLCLVSGGASALLFAPDGARYADVRALCGDLLESGAAISEVNTVRRKLCLLKGGGLARLAAPARVFALLLSDVTDNDPAVIGSGLSVSDPDTPADALAVLDRWGLAHPAVRRHLEAAGSGKAPATASETHVLEGAGPALAAAAAVLRAAGVRAHLLSPDFAGESGEAARFHAGVARGILETSEAAAAPVALLSGGETTVRLPAGTTGSGGPNSHFLLALAVELWDEARVQALAADTDGHDGTGGAAGGIFGPALCRQARKSEAEAALAEFDSGGFLSRHGHALVSGPTGTNVNDLRLVLVSP